MLQSKEERENVGDAINLMGRRISLISLISHHLKL
jgi:hypothetical protein